MKILIFSLLIGSLTFVCGCDDGSNNTNNVNNVNNVNNASCGNAVIEGVEVCDGVALGDATCGSLGYAGGTLACLADCTGYDTAACTGEPGPYGFQYRLPQTRSLSCEGTPTDFVDADHVCTFAYGGVTGYIYFQATPTECEVTFAHLPIYTTLAWISIDDVVTDLASPEYNFGGNHHNDSFGFSHDGTPYFYYHSSFGWGWRACAPMDCIQVLDGEGGILEDGCTTDRTLPIVCTPILEDGTFGSLEDTFEKCAGDPNAK